MTMLAAGRCAAWVALVSLTVLWTTDALGQTVALRAVDDIGRARPLRLETARFVTSIQHQWAQTRLDLVHHNATDDRLEGTFHFGGSAGSTVSAFAYYRGEEKIVGEVFEKKVARDVYDRTTRGGRDPGLLEQRGEGSFSFKVFPIEPGEKKRTQLVVDQWLEREGDTVTFRIPLPDKGRGRVRIEDDREITSVDSPSHQLDVHREGPGKVSVEVAAPNAGSGGELVLRYRIIDDPWALAVRVHRRAGEAATMVVTLAAPPKKQATQPTQRDVTVALDRSGSMFGESFDQARSAVHDLLGRMGPGDRFNVIAFDSGTKALYEAPRPVNDVTRREVTAFLRDLGAEGGTDIAQALKATFERQDDQSERGRTLVLITDGQSNAEEALAAAAHDTHSVRILTLGIGPEVDAPLLRRLAHSHGGRFLHVHRASAIRDRMATLWNRFAPVATDWSLTVKGGEVRRVYPRGRRDLYPDDEIRWLAKLRGKGTVDVVLKGQGPNGPMVLRKRIQMPVSADLPWVEKLWAQARVAHLLELNALHGDDDERVAEVVELALVHNLVTPYTSFLAIPASELTRETSSLLGSARLRKSRLLRDSARRGTLDGWGDDDDDDDDSYTRGFDCPADFPGCGGGVDMEAASPPAAPRGGGCAGCAVADTSDLDGAWLMLLGLALASARRCGRQGSTD